MLHPLLSLIPQSVPRETSEESPECSALLTTSPGIRGLQGTAKGLPKGSALAQRQHWLSDFLKDLQVLPGQTASDFSQMFQFPCDCYQKIKKPLFPY